MTEQFCMLTHEMMRATHWISRATGEQFKLTGDQKVMWVWMEKRYKFFRSLGKDWFDNQDAIAVSTGCDASTVKRFIGKLVKHGYIEVERKNGRGFIRSNRYTILAPLQVHVGKAPISSVGANGEGITPVVEDWLDAPVIASQELTLVRVFEDVPLEAYMDTPPQAPVIVHKRLQLLDEVPDVAAPLLTRGAVVEYVCDDPLPW